MQLYIIIIIFLGKKSFLIFLELVMNFFSIGRMYPCAIMMNTNYPLDALILLLPIHPVDSNNNQQVVNTNSRKT